jgi:hypothetical protein
MVTDAQLLALDDKIYERLGGGDIGGLQFRLRYCGRIEIYFNIFLKGASHSIRSATTTRTVE